MSLVNCVYAGHHKTLLIVLYLMFYSYNDTTEKSYSVAINVPKNLCQGNFDPLNEPFSTLKKNATDVKNAIYTTTNQFYKSEDLLAVGPSTCDCIKLQNCKKTDICTLIENCTSKSVSVLLQNDSSTTFKSFLQRRNDSCVVIYTVYSPCLESGVSKIIPNLDNLTNHTGIKAFVFKKVYNVDGICSRCSDLSRTFTEIVSRVPFYCFENKTVLSINK